MIMQHLVIQRCSNTTPLPGAVALTDGCATALSVNGSCKPARGKANR